VRIFNQDVEIQHTLGYVLVTFGPYSLALSGHKSKGSQSDIGFQSIRWLICLRASINSSFKFELSAEIYALKGGLTQSSSTQNKATKRLVSKQEEK
jgi:hypothetical protein